jgi:hypothetical protein
MGREKHRERQISDTWAAEDARRLQREAKQIVHKLNILEISEEHDAVACKGRHADCTIVLCDRQVTGKACRVTAANPSQKVCFRLEFHNGEGAHGWEHNDAIVITPKHAAMQMGAVGDAC